MERGITMSEAVFATADKDDIEELVRLRLAYIAEDFGSVNENERRAIEEQLPDYFERRLGKELIAFVARAEGRLVAAGTME